MDLGLGLLLSSLIPMLFGGGSNSDTQTTTTESTAPYRSPLLALMEPYLLQSLGGNLSRLQNFGYSSGMQMPGASGDMWQTLSELLTKEWPNITKGYGDNSCESRCKARWPNDTTKQATCKAACQAPA